MIIIFGRNRNVNIRPSQTFFLPAVQERNKQNLLNILEAATPIIEEIAKVKPETWNSMRGVFSGIAQTFGVGISGAATPFNMGRNRFMNVFQGALAPLQVGLNNLSNQVESFALQNQTGAIAGGIGGGILGAFIGHPALGALFGSMVGAGFQALVESIAGPGGAGVSGGFPTATSAGVINTGDQISLFQTSAAQGAIVPINVVNRRFPNVRGFARKIALSQEFT